MLFSKKAVLSASSLVLLSIVGACSSNVNTTPVSVNGDANFIDSNLVTKVSENISQSKQDPNHFYIDAGHGQKTGASFSVKLNLGNDVFKTKSTDGNPYYTASDVLAFNINLFEGSTSSAPSTVPGTPTAAAVLSSTLSATTTFNPSGTSTLTFINVGANTSGNGYYVSVSAHNVASGLSSASNITNTTGTSFTDPLGKAYLSSTGGDTGTGYVTVTATTGTAGAGTYLKVGSAASLGVALKLADGTLAKVDSTVTVTNGSAGTGTVSLQ